MNNRKDSPENDHDDAELSNRYNAIRKEQPPSTVDKAIIKYARDAVRKEKKRSVLTLTGWLVPLATAASVVVAVGLIRLLPENQVSQLPIQPKSPAMLEEKEAAATVPSNRSERRQKIERARLQNEITSKSAPLNRAMSDTESLPEPDDEQRTKELKAKAKADTSTNGKADQQAPPVAVEEPPKRDALVITSLVTAQQWTEHISELIARGKIEQARLALEEFERRYPQHPQITKFSARLKE